MRRTRRMVLVLLAGALLVAGCATGKDAVVQGSNFQFVSPGGKTRFVYEGADRKPLTTLSGDSLTEQGKQITLSDFAGKVVVINIWGAWCGPCRSEAPELEKVYQQTKAVGGQILGVDVRDFDRDQPEDFVRDRNITYPSIYDPPGRSLLALKGFPRSTVPATIVLDRQHRVAAIYLDALLASDLLPEVNKLLAEK